MAVTFTANIGLAKPTDTELAENWVNNTKLQEDNNLIIIDKTDINMISYTPTIIGHTTAPGLGAGSIRGEYIDIQGFVFGNFIVEFLDPAITVGLGEYGFSLPFPVDNVFHTVGTALNNTLGGASCIGEGYVHDNSAIATRGTVAVDVVTIAGVSYARLVTETFVGKTNRFFRDNMPFAVANSDRFSINFLYKKL